MGGSMLRPSLRVPSIRVQGSNGVLPTGILFMNTT